MTNWYIRRSRRRFWKSQDDEDKAQAYATLYTVLLQLSKIAAPFVPFVSEAIYRNLRRDGAPESVHLCDFPLGDAAQRDEELEAEMASVMTVVRLGRLLRTEHTLKVRQPLSQIHIISRNADTLRRLEVLGDIILDELNVKVLVFDDDELRLAKLKGKADFKRLGPRLGQKVKQAAAAIARLGDEQLESLARGEATSLTLDDETVSLTPEDVLIERIPREGLVVASEGDLLVALETELTPELVAEGLTREFVNKVQNMRKGAGFEVTQRIHVTFHADAELAAAVDAQEDYVKTETLALACTAAAAEPADGAAWDINGHACVIAVTPA